MTKVIQPTQDGRDELGRFTPGNSLSPGRKPRAFEESRLNLLSDRVSDEDLLAIVDKAVEQAKQGDKHAREWLSSYLLPPRAIVAARWLESGEGTTRTIRLSWSQTTHLTPVYDDLDEYEDEDEEP